MALHALEYCERLFYLEEVEEIRLADHNVFAGRTLHQELDHKPDDATVHRNFQLQSNTLGLKGKCDAFRRRDGAWVPYEHKRGRAMTTPQGHAAWPSDSLQAIAYALLLEEHLQTTIPEARIRYHASNTTVRIPIDQAARHRLHKALQRARQLRQSTTRPPITTNDRLCIKCSLAPVCLPEEERLAKDPTWQPIRLFPHDRDGQIIHVANHAARITRTADTITIHTPDTPPQKLPISEIAAIVLHGYPQITTQAIHALTAQNIPVHFLSTGGRYLTSLAPAQGTVQRRIRQFQALTDPATRLRLAKQLVTARAQSQLRYLLRATRNKAQRPQPINDALQTIRQAIKAIPQAQNPETLRGHEGIAARAYHAALPHILRPDLPLPLRPTTRTRRPPRNPFDALLSFGYSLLQQTVTAAIIAVGLDPAFGFYHTPRSAAQPLVLDLMELFRLPIWDIALIGSLNRLQWNPERDFDITPRKTWLSKTGRRKAIHIYEQRLTQTWKHPVTQYSLSYERTIELEARLLEKEWTSTPGLFAKARLR